MSKRPNAFFRQNSTLFPSFKFELRTRIFSCPNSFLWPLPDESVLDSSGNGRGLLQKRISTRKNESKMSKRPNAFFSSKFYFFPFLKFELKTRISFSKLIFWWPLPDESVLDSSGNGHGLLQKNHFSKENESKMNKRPNAFFSSKFFFSAFSVLSS